MLVTSAVNTLLDSLGQALRLGLRLFSMSGWYGKNTPILTNLSNENADDEIRYLLLSMLLD